MKELKILFVEDLPIDVEVAQRALKKENINFSSRVVNTADEFEKALREFTPDLIISDYAMPKFDGMKALRITRLQPHYIPFIILTGSMNEETAVACMKAGADDYVLKEKIRRLPFAVQEVLAKSQAEAEKKKAKKDLKQSEKKFRSLAENTSDVIAVMDLQGKITYMSRSIEEMGFLIEEIEGTNIQKLLTPESYNLAMSRLRKRLKGEKINAPFEVGILNKTGKVIPFELNTSTVTEKGELKGIQIVARNITERKQAEIRQTTLLKIANALKKMGDITEFYSKIRKLLGEVIDTTNFYVALYNEETDMISLPYNVDQKDEYETFPAGKTLTKYVIQTAKPLFAKRAELDDLTQKGIIETIGTPAKVWLGVPLMAKNKVFGVIALQSYDDPDLYSEKDVEMLRFVSEEIALAIQRAQFVEQIKQSLREKDTLLQELYHRTKNNMQVITSLLRMQSRKYEIEKTESNEVKFIKTTFQEIINRINAMSLVHQKLYQSNDLSLVNLKEYIADLTCQISNTYSRKSSDISLKYELDDAFVQIDSAIPLGLVLNELISNVFKHAFPDDRNGIITLGLNQEESGKINIRVIDNGVGPPPDLDLRKNSSMGLETMFTLVEYQLNGTVTYRVDNGVQWYISFNDDIYKKRI